MSKILVCKRHVDDEYWVNLSLTEVEGRIRVVVLRLWKQWPLLIMSFGSWRTNYSHSKIVKINYQMN